MGLAAEAHIQEYCEMGMLRDVLLDRCPGAHDAVRVQNAQVGEGIGFLGEGTDMVDCSTLVVGGAGENAYALLPLLLPGDYVDGESGRRGTPFQLLQLDFCKSSRVNQSAKHLEKQFNGRRGP